MQEVVPSLTLPISSAPAPPPQSAEVWYEVAGELALEGLRPVTPDQEALQQILHSDEERAEFIHKHQVYKCLVNLAMKIP